MTDDAEVAALPVVPPAQPPFLTPPLTKQPYEPPRWLQIAKDLAILIGIIAAIVAAVCGLYISIMNKVYDIPGAVNARVDILRTEFEEYRKASTKEARSAVLVHSETVVMDANDCNPKPGVYGPNGVLCTVLLTAPEITDQSQIIGATLGPNSGQGVDSRWYNILVVTPNHADILVNVLSGVFDLAKFRVQSQILVFYRSGR